MKLVTSVFGTLGLSALGFALPTGYRLELIASAPLEREFITTKINNKGNLVFSQLGRSGATFYDQNRGFMTFYGNEYGAGSNLTGFNDNDMVSGSTRVINEVLTTLDTGYVWNPDEGFIQTFPNTSSQFQGVTVDAINNSGQLAISRVLTQYPFYYYRFAGYGLLNNANINMIPNPGFQSDLRVGERMIINNQGEIINRNIDSNRGYYYRIGDPTFVELPSLYAPSAYGGVGLRDINNNGFIFGKSTFSSPPATTRGTSVIWNRSGQVVFQMENLPGSDAPLDFLDAIDTENSALIKDNRRGHPNRGQFAIWNQVSGVVNIPALLDSSADGFTDFNLQEMNNSYQIVGVARKNGMSQLVRLNPVPEPATFLALGAGMAGLLARRRKHAG